MRPPILHRGMPFLKRLPQAFVTARMSRWPRGLLGGRCLGAALAISAAACARVPPSPPELTPRDTRPVYRIEVADADELAILEEQLRVEVVQGSAREVLVRVPGPADLARLREAGYEPVAVPVEQVECRIVRVPRGRSEETLLGTGVVLLRREPKEWVVRGSLTQLDQARRLGFRLLPLVAEPRPREVEIVVSSREDVQRVYDLGVDILGVDEVRRGVFRIGATAFDNQIDALRKLGYTVNPR